MGGTERSKDSVLGRESGGGDVRLSLKKEGAATDCENCC